MSPTNLRKERLEAITTQILLRRQEDSGVRPLPSELIKIRAISYERHLTNLGIEPQDYAAIYELAMQIYNADENHGAFNVDYLIKAAQRHNLLKVKKMQTVRAVKKLPHSTCTVCRGTTLKFTQEGKTMHIAYEEIDGKLIPQRCGCVKEIEDAD